MFLTYIAAFLLEVMINLYDIKNVPYLIRSIWSMSAREFQYTI